MQHNVHIGDYSGELYWSSAIEFGQRNGVLVAAIFELNVISTIGRWSNTQAAEVHMNDLPFSSAHRPL